MEIKISIEFNHCDIPSTGVAYAKWACCSYGTAHSKETTGYDCAKIPGPLKTGGTTFNAGAMGFCGGELGTGGGTAAATVCCKFFIEDSDYNCFIRYFFQRNKFLSIFDFSVICMRLTKKKVKLPMDLGWPTYSKDVESFFFCSSKLTNKNLSLGCLM